MGVATRLERQVVFVFLLIVVYYLPSIVAIARRAPDADWVLVLNFVFGWTIVGWMISLAMARR